MAGSSDSSAPASARSEAMIGAPASASSALASAACRAAAAARAASGSVAGPAGVSGAGGAGVVSGWRAARASTRLRTSNGTIVATACGMLLITPAILSAVRSCSSRPSRGEKDRRGSTTVTLVPGCSTSRLTSSADARRIRRSGVSIISSGTSWP